MIKKERLLHLKTIARLGGLAKSKLRPSIIDRFYEKTVKDSETGCWNWTGYKSKGYGKFKINGKITTIPRWSYEYFNNYKIPSKKIFVCHHCDNRACVNPDHLFLGTNRDNMIDALKKGRLPVGERHHNIKLSVNDAKNIIKLRSLGVTRKVIAKEFGVSLRPIDEVLSGKHWTVKSKFDDGN